MWTISLLLQRRCLCVCLALICAPGGAIQAQLSNSAYRVLGQQDLQQNGLNMVQGFECNAPAAVALDSRGNSLHLYVSDTGNHRVLGWRDIQGYQNGDAPAIVLGQPNRRSSAALGIGPAGFNMPLGLAVHPFTGDLYVADFQNNRVLRFPDPLANPARVEPDAVFGQADFSRSVQAASPATLNRPRAVAFDRTGNLWVVDSGNHRVLRYPADLLNALPPPEPDIVIGQRDFSSGMANGGAKVSAAGFDVPTGLAFDDQSNLYVSDFNNGRVLRFTGPFVRGQDYSAASVWGQKDFVTGSAARPSATTLGGPAGIAIIRGDLYVAVPGENRVLVFGIDAPAGTAAKNVYGQTDFVTATANSGVAPKTSPNTLSAPLDVRTDPGGGIYIADTANHRVLCFTGGSKTAARVWGQTDFTANGPNQIKPASLNAPVRIVVDYSRAPYALYVADVNNSRVLCWKDSARFRNGDPADFVIGQPDMLTSAPNSGSPNSQLPSRSSLSSPAGLAVDPGTGALYVADAGNNRVLRYSRPVDQVPGGILPDAVIGQSDFNSATSAAPGPASLRKPFGLALAPDGSLFVADTGNNRVLEFRPGTVTGAVAVRVYGQPNLFSAGAPAVASAQSLSAPQGLFLDSARNLYVADTGANRILVFPNTQTAPPAGMAAAFVIGQTGFQASSAAALNAPYDVSVDSAANIYVSDFGNNRVVMFPSVVFLPIAGAVPTRVIGQRDSAGTGPNWNGTARAATPEGLFGPAGIYIDRQDTLYVGDIGNNRVVHFLKAAAVVNSATYQAGVAVSPGSLAAIFGFGLATETESAAGAPWPSSLAQRQIVFNEQTAAPVQYMGTSQTNFQIPWSVPLGLQRFAVRLSETGELIAGGTVAVAAASPGLFTSAQTGQGQAAATNQNGSINGSSNPAAKGSVITLYGTGQGQVSPPIQDGAAAGASPLSGTVTVPTSDGRTCVVTQPSMCVAVGSAFGEIQYSGLAPGFVGLWQINVKLPADVPSGNVPVRVLINGIPGNVVTIAVR